MREDAKRKDTGIEYRVHGKKEDASFQIIVLGSSGGPREDTITGLLVRSPFTEWKKSSVIAVDAGAHLASIIRVLEQQMPMNSEELPLEDHETVLEHGPFAGVRFPWISAEANALYFFRDLLHSFLITHPHLDHLSAMAINTPALEYGREAKAIVALPSTIEAIKTHIFNDSIWPNLSDEGHGVGFVTYRRLIEGGNPRLGSGEARGYVNVCDGLATKCWSVSHGRCRRHTRHSIGSGHPFAEPFSFMNLHGDGYNFPTRRISRVSDDHGYFAALAAQHTIHPPPLATPGAINSAVEKDHGFQAVDSSAFFIRNDTNGNEILVFGDIEPDSVSISPRNHIVWDDAAPKIALGILRAIFIECSYTDSVRNEDLYGHLCPRHLIAELNFLAQRVLAVKKQKLSEVKLQEPPDLAALRKKRKRHDTEGNGEAAPSMASSPPQTRSAERAATPGHSNPRRRTVQAAPMTDMRSQPRHRESDSYVGSGRPQTPRHGLMPPTLPAGHPHSPSPQPQMQPTAPPPLPKGSNPLAGVTVHIIHVKDTLMDGPRVGSVILKQLQDHSAEAGLGCEFDITSCGEEIWV